MTYLNKRTDVKSVFGKYTIEANKTDLAFTADGGSVYDYLVRNGGREGLQSKIRLADTNIESLADPIAFLTKKQASLVEMVKSLKSAAPAILERYINRNLPIKEAREKTRKELDEKFLRLMKDHEEDFPRATLDRIIKKQVGN